MPVRKLRDSRTGEERELEEVVRGGLGEVCPPPFARIVAEKILNDTRHAGLAVTTTALFGCPLRTLIPRVVDGLVVDLDDQVAMTIGTVMHEKMAESAPEGRKWISEKCTCPEPFPVAEDRLGTEDYLGLKFKLVGGKWHFADCGEARCTFEGVVDGVKVSGLVDAIEEHDDGTVTLWDWKFRNAGVMRFRQEASPEDRMQLSVNAYLAGQEGVRVRDCVSATITMKGFITTRFEPWDIEAVLDARPNGGKEGNPPTVREILHELAGAIERLEAGEEYEEVFRGMKPVGEEMWRGYGRNACTSYCSVAEVCTRLREGF